MGKTYKDIRKFDIKRHKEAARESTMDMDLRTRVKPTEKRERGGGKNWKDLLNVEHDEDDDEEGETIEDQF